MAARLAVAAALVVSRAAAVVDSRAAVADPEVAVATAAVAEEVTGHIGVYLRCSEKFSALGLSGLSTALAVGRQPVVEFFKPARVMSCQSLGVGWGQFGLRFFRVWFAGGHRLIKL